MDRTKRRRQKLQQLINEVGTKAELARITDIAPAYISQMMRTRHISSRYADRIEEATGKPNGWFDQWGSDEIGNISIHRLPAAQASMIKRFNELPVRVQSSIRALIFGYKAD